MKLRFSNKQIVFIVIALFGWATVYLNQDFDVVNMEFRFSQYAQGNIPENGETAFVINKTLRFLLNDLFSILFIYGLFRNISYVKVALLVMAFGLVVLLPVYLVLAIKYQEEGFNLLTFLHRITMNPWLMILLIPAFYYVEIEKQDKKT